MAFHDDTFWAVTGGAAPVIALAAVVSVGQLMDLSSKRQRIALFLIAMAWVQILNIVIQSCVLGVSLTSLASHANDLPPVAITVLEVVGIALLLVGAIAAQMKEKVFIETPSSESRHVRNDD